MSFGDNAGGVSALDVLQSYAAKLDEKYGERAFGYFSKADMRVLTIAALAKAAPGTGLRATQGGKK